MSLSKYVIYMVFLIGNYLVLSKGQMKPRITMHPSLVEVIEGENVNIICTLDSGCTDAWVYLYRNNEKNYLSASRTTGEQCSVTLEIQVTATAYYMCVYSLSESGELGRLQRSDPLTVSMRDRPAKPEISLNKNFTTVIRGERWLLTCKAPLQDSDNIFHLYKVKNSFQITPSKIMKGKHSVTFNLSEIINLGVEHYRCKYNTLVLGRPIDSDQSDPVILTVIDRPLKPICLLETQGPVTENEQNVTVNCTAPSAYPIMKFYFYVNSQNQLHIPQVTEGQNSATIITSVPRLKIKTEYFTCRYQVKIAGRWVESDTSNPQRLVVSDGQYTQLIIGLGSALLILLIILLTCKVANIKRDTLITRDQVNTIPDNFDRTYRMIDLTDLNAECQERLGREEPIYDNIK
ncbi:uncharacterized protein [Heterodontus francisci]|uniref:uncharacterized protein n=1 Tax=Heterodontus francisci TaxID=7792 RepID=UPI00355BFFE0